MSTRAITIFSRLFDMTAGMKVRGSFLLLSFRQKPKQTVLIIMQHSVGLQLLKIAFQAALCIGLDTVMRVLLDKT
jgi:hypothetical protein